MWIKCTKFSNSLIDYITTNNPLNLIFFIFGISIYKRSILFNLMKSVLSQKITYYIIYELSSYLKKAREDKRKMKINYSFNGVYIRWVHLSFTIYTLQSSIVYSSTYWKINQILWNLQIFNPMIFIEFICVHTTLIGMYWLSTLQFKRIRIFAQYNIFYSNIILSAGFNSIFTFFYLFILLQVTLFYVL